MLKDVTLGRYYGANSPVDRLDPRTKIFSLIAFIICLFIAKTPAEIAIMSAVLLIATAVSEIPARYIFRGFRTIIFVIAITDIISIVSNPEEWLKTVIVTLRVFETVMASNLLTLTTKPKDIADGLEKSLRFLKIFKVPVRNIATIISIALRFIPVLTLEADRIVKAQKARGASFEKGSPVRRAKSLIPVLIPLFSSSLNKADTLALAMDSRLYGAGKASRLHPLCYTKSDLLIYCVSVSFAVIFITGSRLWF